MSESKPGTEPTVKEWPGVKMKFIIHKADGTPCNPGAVYFVLRFDYEQSDSNFARASRTAGRVFARTVANSHPELARDIEAVLDQTEWRPPCGCREAACPHEPMFDQVWRYGEDDGLVPRAAVEVQKEKDAKKNPYDIQCPRCDSQISKHCVDPLGGGIEYPHSERWRAVIRAKE